MDYVTARYGAIQSSALAASSSLYHSPPLLKLTTPGRAPEERRYPILVAFLRQTHEDISDEVIEMFDLILADFYRRAGNQDVRPPFVERI